MSTAAAPVVIGAALLLQSAVAIAMWEKLTDAELVARSELIVRGELIGTTRFSPAAGQPALWLGVIRVDEMLKSSAGANVVLLSLPSPERPVSSSDTTYRKGQQGLWFLRPRPPEGSGVYLADHPQRFVPARESQRIRELEQAVAAAHR